MGKKIANANEYVTKALKEKSTAAYYFGLKEAIQKNYQTSFCTNLQNYVTRIGLIVANCFNDKLKNSTFIGSIEYLCTKILHDPQLLKVLRAIEINENANLGKHSLNNINIDIKESMHQYNRLIKGIVATTKINAFEICFLRFEEKKNLRDVPIVKEKREHVYSTIANVKFQIKLCPDYKVDPYTKSLISKVTVFWPEANPNKLLNVVIKCAKNGRTLCTLNNIDITKVESKKATEIHIKESDLDRRVLYVKATIELLKNERIETTTGILWFKKENVSYNKEIITTKTEELSQFYRP